MFSFCTKWILNLKFSKPLNAVKCSEIETQKSLLTSYLCGLEEIPAVEKDSPPFPNPNKQSRI